MPTLTCNNITELLDQQTKIKSTACNLCDYSKDLRKKYLFPVPSRGSGKLLIIGDQAYPEEHNTEHPFSGAFGAVFLDYLNRYVGLNDSHCTFTYAVKCTSVNKKNPVNVKSLDFKNCSRYLLQEIKLIDPVLIVFIGKDSARSLIDNKKRTKLAMGTPFQEVILGRPRWCYIMTHPLAAKSSTGAVPLVQAHFKGVNRFLHKYTNVYDKIRRPDVGEAVKDREYVLVNTEEQLQDMYNELYEQKYIAVDTETNSLQVWRHSFKIIGVSLASTGEKGYYIPLNHTNNKSKKRYKQLDWETVVKPLLDKLFKKSQLIFHNLYYDYCVFKKSGLNIFKLDPSNNVWTHDSLLMTYLEDENPSHGLKDQMFFKFGVKPQEFKNVMTGSDAKTFEFVPPNKALMYAADDAINTLMLFKKTVPVVQKESKKYTGGKLMNNIYPTELQTIRILADSHLKGIRIDKKYLEQLEFYVQEDLEDIRQIVFNISTAVTQINSGPKLLTFLNSILTKSFLSDFTTKYKELNVQEKTLHLLVNFYDKAYKDGRKPGKWRPKKLNNYIKSIIKFKHLYKIKSTYIDAVNNLAQEEDGIYVIHANINPIGTTSGRMSSTNPNLQNIPREVPETPKKCFHCKAEQEYLKPDATLSRFTCNKCSKVTKSWSYDIRRLFIPREGYKFIASDYSGMELYLAAAVSGDTNLYDVFKRKEVNPEDPNGDMHVVTASSIMGITPDEWKVLSESGDDGKKRAKMFRQIAKTVNYLVLYGGSAEGLQRTLLGLDLDKDITTCETYVNGFYKAFPKVKTWFSDQKYEIAKKGILINNYGRIRHVLKSGGEVLSAINMLIQGLGAQIIKESLVNIDNAWQNKDKYPLLVIHDENVLEVPVDDLMDASNEVLSIMEVNVVDKITVKLKVDPTVGINSLSKSEKGIL